MIKLDDHVGKMLVAFDIEVGCSPAFQGISTSNVSPPEIAAKLTDDLRKMFESYCDVHEWILNPVTVTVNPRTGIIKNAETRHKEFEDLLNRAQDAFADSNQQFEEELDLPENNRRGWWHVNGIRHDAHVLADSAREAIKKAQAAEKVGDWESATAHFLGETLPEVF